METNLLTLKGTTCIFHINTTNAIDDIKYNKPIQMLSSFNSNNVRNTQANKTT